MKNLNLFVNVVIINQEEKANLIDILMTLKHKNKENTTKIQQNTTEKGSYICECGKKYLHRASLHNHKKKCNNGNELNKELKVPKISSELILKLINENNELKNTILKENQELRNQITELIPKVGNNNNNLKQKFNINVFLNEKIVKMRYQWMNLLIK